MRWPGGFRSVELSTQPTGFAELVSVHVPTLEDMGRIIFDTAVSFNGWIADEHGSLEWLFAVPNEGMPEGGLIPTSATVLVEGSTTYEWVVQTEQLLEHPEKWQQFYGEKPTFVFTTRMLATPAGADVRFLNGPVSDHLLTIQQAAGDGDIWVVGGGDLAGQFLDLGALDQVALTIAPVALSGGAPLLPRMIGAERLHLVSATAYGQFARLIYNVSS